MSSRGASMYVQLSVHLVALVVATASAVVILAQEHRQRVNQLAAALMLGVVWWSFCDVLRLAAPDAEAARRMVRWSSPAWCFIGPLGLHLLSQVLVKTPRWVGRLLPFSYAGSAALVAMVALAPWGVAEMALGPGGWHPRVGLSTGIVAAYTLAHVLPTIVLALMRIGRSPSESDRRQARGLGVGMAIPFVLIVSTNVVLPWLGFQPVRLGTLSLAVFGAVIAWSTRRFGYSPLARGGFSRQILDAHPDGVALVLYDGQIGSASEGLARLAGQPAPALVGQPLTTLIEAPLLDPPREVQELESELCTADGHRIPVSVTTRVFQDRQGLDFALVVVVRDLREVVALRSQLVTSGRLAAMGQLAAGIAHEINNPMAYVRANLGLLQGHWHQLAKGAGSEQERVVLEDEGNELLAESLEGVERACAIVRDINGFSHAGTGERSPVELEPLIRNVLRVATPHLGSHVEVETDFAETPPALGAAQELKQVLLNLVLNAAHATDGVGRVRVRTEPEGDCVAVVVEDDGCGMDAATAEKIFDPFFTTKPVGQGTGIGLFISYQIVRSHGGQIGVDSEPGRGTRVRVCLPVAPETDSD